MQGYLQGDGAEARIDIYIHIEYQQCSMKKLPNRMKEGGVVDKRNYFTQYNINSCISFLFRIFAFLHNRGVVFYLFEN